MSQRKRQPSTSTSRKYHVNNDQNSLSQSSKGEGMSQKDPKVAITPDGSIFVKTLVQIDPDSDLFMRVAERAYADHERSLVACSRCGRTFFPDRIEKHEKNCAASKLPPSCTKSQQRNCRQK